MNIALTRMYVEGPCFLNNSMDILNIYILEMNCANVVTFVSVYVCVPSALFDENDVFNIYIVVC